MLTRALLFVDFVTRTDCAQIQGVPFDHVPITVPRDQISM